MADVKVFLLGAVITLLDLLKIRSLNGQYRQASALLLFLLPCSPGEVGHSICHSEALPVSIHTQSQRIHSFFRFHRPAAAQKQAAGQNHGAGAGRFSVPFSSAPEGHICLEEEHSRKEDTGQPESVIIPDPGSPRFRHTQKEHCRRDPPSSASQTRSLCDLVPVMKQTAQGKQKAVQQETRPHHIEPRQYVPRKIRAGHKRQHRISLRRQSFLPEHCRKKQEHPRQDPAKGSDPQKQRLSCGSSLFHVFQHERQKRKAGKRAEYRIKTAGNVPGGQRCLLHLLQIGYPALS